MSLLQKQEQSDSTDLQSSYKFDMIENVDDYQYFNASLIFSIRFKFEL